MSSPSEWNEWIRQNRAFLAVLSNKWFTFVWPLSLVSTLLDIYQQSRLQMQWTRHLWTLDTKHSKTMLFAKSHDFKFFLLIFLWFDKRGGLVFSEDPLEPGPWSAVCRASRLGRGEAHGDLCSLLHCSRRSVRGDTRQHVLDGFVPGVDVDIGRRKWCQIRKIWACIQMDTLPSPPLIPLTLPL